MRTSPEFRKFMAERLALPMFGFATLFLALVAVLVVLWVDVPRLTETHPPIQTGSGPNSKTPVPPGEPASPEKASPEKAGTQLPPSVDPADVDAAAGMARFARAELTVVLILEFLWPIFWIEFLLQFLWRDRTTSFWRSHHFGFFVCLCPPLRISARNHDMEGKIWVPTLGWTTVEDELRERLEKAFSVPMIIIALMILPVLLVEFTMKHQIAEYPWLRYALHISTGLIWFAFAVEFIVMVSIARKRLRYCKEHWLDLAIIVLPLVSFLRSLRSIRAMRLARLAKIEQLSEMGRLYRLRGLAMRGFRAFMLLKLVNRILRVPPEKRLRALTEQLREKEREVERLRQRIHEVQESVEQCKREKEGMAKTPTKKIERVARKT